ncbi:MAG: ATP-dependent RNA helicase HrpA [Pseudohongiellaceae bacterium]
MHQSPSPTELRKQSLPRAIEISGSLPIREKAEQIKELLLKNQVLVVAGETGSGKTTQLPKICLQAGFGVRGLIGHTQPRRLAALSVANRIAEELGVKPGEGVGYQIRFSDKTSPSTFLKLMTDGILLNEIQNDRNLRKYEVLIIDEAHERSLNIDFILGYLRQLLPRRPDLKLIITSATIDLQKFSAHFGNAPVVTVSGRSYPVSILYKPMEENADNDTSFDPQSDAIISAVREIGRSESDAIARNGDILVFLSSEKEIRETALALRKQKLAHTEILPLYARLRQTDQEKIFKTHFGRRIILSTNIAETSLTVPGIRYVIDAGFARISRYSIQSKIQRLPIEPISKASADQRAGRCGRISEGICIRLYSESDYLGRPEYTDPEILRTNLAAVILQMLSLQLGEISDFPFLDPPSTKAINDGFSLLFELNAIDDHRQITALGRKMAGFPVDPRFARILLSAAANNCLREALIIVSGLSIQDPREGQGDKGQRGTEIQARFTHPQSGFLSLVNLWNEFEENRQTLTGSQLRRYCARNSLSFSRMLEWREVHRQLVSLCRGYGFSLNQEAADYASIHKSLVSGLLNFIACAAEKGIYLGTRSRKFQLLRNPSQPNIAAKWIVTSQIIETSFAFATIAAKIEPEWVIYEAEHLIKRSWSEPHWSKKRQQVEAFEKTTLYGLVLEDRKPVNYGPLDPDLSHEIFINEALVEQQFLSDLAFYQHNHLLLAEIAKDEDKLRKQAWLVDTRKLAEFYSARVPTEVWDRQTFITWYNQNPKRHNESLRMQRQDLMSGNEFELLQRQFPDHTNLHENKLSVSYKFEPGSDVDGAVLEVPVELLTQLNESDIDWIVPGQIRERCIFLLKSLPKPLRKIFIPVPAFVDQILPELNPDSGTLLDALIARIGQVKGISIEKSLFSKVEVPAFLKVKLKVVGSHGEVLALGTDLNDLREQLLQSADCVLTEAAKESRHPIEIDALRDWNFADLPEQITIGDKIKLLRYPALIDLTDSVAVRLLSERQTAMRETIKGVCRLLMFRTAQQHELLTKQFRQAEKRWGLKRPVFLVDFNESAAMATYIDSFQIRKQIPGSRDEFDKLAGEGRSKISQCGNELASLLDRIVELHFNVRLKLKALATRSPSACKDIENQLEMLFPSEFLLSVDRTWLDEYPRYLQAVLIRLEKIVVQPDKDKMQTEMVMKFQQRWVALANAGGDVNRSDTIIFRWMLEEYRVSLFAQQLKTSLPVSEQRLEKQWARTGKIGSD